MMKKKIIVATASAVLSALIICGCGQEPDFKINKESKETRKDVDYGLTAYASEDAGFTFLYPETETVEYSDEDGVTVYLDEEDELPYLIIKKTDKPGMTPTKYFKDSNKQVLRMLDDVASTSICEAKIGDKTTYMTRYVGSIDDDDVVIERYIEIYENYYIEYSALSEEIGAVNTELYYAIKTLSTNLDMYGSGFSEELESYKNSDLGIKISLPVMLEVKELTVGYIATGDEAVILCVVCDADSDGNKIGSRNDFLSAAAADSGFVASFIGAESAEFGRGSKETIKGVEYYSYPMDIQNGETEMSGRMLLADYEDGGCVVVLYAINDGSEMYEEMEELCESSIETLKI